VVTKEKIINAVGDLTIGGVTNQVSLQAAYVLNADESITCTGTKSIKMSDYEIKAPSFMLGSLKTGNEVIIDILLKLKE
jgi:polyisoprenoid-binding protein YceI